MRLESVVEEGKELHVTGKFNEALACYQRAYEQQPSCAELNSLIGQIFAKQSNHSSALNYFRIAAEARPTEFSHVFNLGCCLQANDQHDEAIDCFKKASMLKDQPSLAYSEWGHCLLCLGDFKGAIKMLKKSLKFDSVHAQTWSDLGECYLEVGKLLDASRCLQRSDHLRSNFLTKYRQCRLAMAKSDKVDFIKHFIEALRFAEENPSQLYRLKSLVEAQERFDIGEFYIDRLKSSILKITGGKASV